MSDDAPKIDEQGLAEWVTYGMGELNYYLLKVARLDEWERLHPRTEEPEDGSTSSS